MSNPSIFVIVCKLQSFGSDLFRRSERLVDQKTFCWDERSLCLDFSWKSTKKCGNIRFTSIDYPARSFSAGALPSCNVSAAKHDQPISSVYLLTYNLWGNRGFCYAAVTALVSCTHVIFAGKSGGLLRTGFSRTTMVRWPPPPPSESPTGTENCTLFRKIIRSGRPDSKAIP